MNATVISSVLVNCFIIALLVVFIILGFRLLKLFDKVDRFIIEMEEKLNYLIDVISKFDKLCNNIYKIKNIFNNSLKLGLDKIFKHKS